MGMDYPVLPRIKRDHVRECDSCGHQTDDWKLITNLMGGPPMLWCHVCDLEKRGGLEGISKPTNEQKDAG